MKASIGIYIHVPFCLSKCPYCDFYSEKASEKKVADYVAAICRAVKQSDVKDRIADSIYFGGGTPSLLSAADFDVILGQIGKMFVLRDPEITLEANPATIDGDKLRDLRALGFNRISFGVQSAVDAELSALGRLHTAEDAACSVLAAKNAGFENISADLMLGIPHQNRESLRKSVEFLTALPLTHVSAYMLKVEAGTPFAKSKERKLCPNDDMLADIYLDCVKLLADKGFEQYEISNFAKKGYESRHNLKYWRCEEYLGIGPSAHSFIDGERFYTPGYLAAFIKSDIVQDGDGGGFEEYAMLRLRLCEGLNLAEAEALFGVNTGRIAKKATALAERGLLNFENNLIALTAQGFLLSNAVTAELLMGY